MRVKINRETFDCLFPSEPPLSRFVGSWIDRDREDGRELCHYYHTVDGLTVGENEVDFRTTCSAYYLICGDDAVTLLAYYANRKPAVRIGA